jgi:hypothetical protein
MGVPELLRIRRPAHYLRRFALFTMVVVPLLPGLSACGVPIGGSVPTPSPPPLLTPTPLLPSPSMSLPTVTPVAQVAGWQTLDSQHWVGYTFPESDVTGVRAQWTEPMVSGTPPAEEFIWIGVGGWASALNNIFQVGTFVYFPPTGGRNQGIWYELVPVQQQAQFPLITVNPGDRIVASVVQLQPSPQTWQIMLMDVSTGVTFTRIVPFPSVNAYLVYCRRSQRGPARPLRSVLPLSALGNCHLLQHGGRHSGYLDAGSDIVR